MRIRRRAFVAAMALAAGLISTPASAQQADDWEFTLSPYLWLSGLEGTVGALGVETDVDLSSSDVLENLEAAGLVRFEAQRNRWALLFDTIFIASEVTAERPPGQVNIDQFIFEVATAYRVHEAAEFLVGARWVSLDSALQLDLPTRTLMTSNDQDWVEPFAGVRLGTDLNDKWTVDARGDIGGFGFEGTVMWNVEAHVGYRIRPHLSLLMGYKVLDINHDNTENDAGSLVYKVTTGGPVLRFDFRF